jgi:hypothetical protein
MKFRIRDLTLVVALLFCVAVTAGCSGDAGRSSPVALDDAELTSTILEIYAEPDRIERTDRLLSVLRGVQPGQGEALRKALDGLDFANREPAWVLVLAGWAKIDGEAATRWVMRNVRLEYVRFLMLDEAIYAWALKDPEGLVRDVEMAVYSQKGWDKASMRALVRGWYDSGKPNLDQWVYNLSPQRGDDRQRAASALIEAKIANEGVESTIEWAKSTMKGVTPFHTYIYSRLAGDIAKIDPERAIAWCDEVCDKPLGKEIPLWIATTWVVNSGADAMDWITARDAKVISVRVGARAAYRRFLLNDQAGALAWMETKTEEERLEQAALQGPLYMYVNERSGLRGHETAIEWSRYVKSDVEREELLKRIARRWLREDPDAAEAWLAQGPLSEDAEMQARKPRPSPADRRRFRAKETVLGD